jgi:hypothetical protein
MVAKYNIRYPSAIVHPMGCGSEPCAGPVRKECSGGLCCVPHVLRWGLCHSVGGDRGAGA